MHQVILLTHGNFSVGIRDSVNFILGAVENVVSLTVTLDETIEKVEHQLKEKIKDFSKDEKVVIITDLAGGSTTQAALRCFSDSRRVYVIAGLNLGLLLEIITLDLSGDTARNLDQLRGCVERSRQSIALVSDVTVDLSADIEGEL